jgi:hypothetical protein
MDVAKLEQNSGGPEEPAVDNTAAPVASTQDRTSDLKVDISLVETRQRAGSLLKAVAISH